MVAGVVLTALLTLSAKKSAKPSEDCLVTSTWPDGTTEKRDCFVLDPNSAEAKAGTKAYAEMKQYLKHDEKWKDWENVEMKWISHHNPDFVVLDDSGNEKERYDLQGWSAQKLEQVMEQKGFKRR